MTRAQQAAITGGRCIMVEAGHRCGFMGAAKDCSWDTDDGSTWVIEVYRGVAYTFDVSWLPAHRKRKGAPT